MTEQSDIIGIFNGEIENSESLICALHKDCIWRENVTLAVSEIHGSKIMGEIRTGGIVAGGKFTGTYSDGKILFTTSNGANRTITWTGRFEENEIRGSWDEEDRRLFVRLTGGRYFSGSWQCKR